MKRNIFFIIFLFIFTFETSLAFADDEELLPINITFQNGHREYTLGAVYGAGSYSWKWTQVQGGTESLNLIVYDSYGNKIAEGLTGFFSSNVSFPVKFKIETDQSDFRLDIKITPHPLEKEEIDYRPNLNNILGSLSDGFGGVVSVLNSGFDTLSSKLSSILHTANKIDKFLSDPQPFYTAVDNLIGSVNNMSNSGPMGVAKQLSDIKFDVGDVDNLPSLEVEFFKGKPKINVFDLSEMHLQIVIIRNLLKAILFLGVVFFIMQSVVPRFKV